MNSSNEQNLKNVKDKNFIKNYVICIKMFGFYKF